MATSTVSDVAPKSDTNFPFSHSRAVIRYAGRPYTNRIFQIMRGSMHKGHVGKRLGCVFGAITCQLYLTYSSYPEKDISDNRTVVHYVERPYQYYVERRTIVLYVERPYQTCSFRVMSVGR